MTPPEGFDPSDPPVARGRRNSELAARLLEEDDTFADAGSSGEANDYVLLPGDTLMAKVTLTGSTELGEAWFTFGAQTRLLDGESEEDAFTRLASVTNTRVLDLAADASERVTALIAEQREEQRHRRIVPRT